MTSKAPWQEKISDEPRVGFVENFGVPEKPPVVPPAPPPELPPPSPLDKIINADRLGFVAQYGAIPSLRKTKQSDGS